MEEPNVWNNSDILSYPLRAHPGDESKIDNPDTKIEEVVNVCNHDVAAPLPQNLDEILNIFDEIKKGSLTQKFFTSKFGCEPRLLEARIKEAVLSREQFLAKTQFIEENPNITILDDARGIYALRTETGHLTGSLYTIADTSIETNRFLKYATEMQCDTKISSLPCKELMVISGSGAQSVVNPYPVDLDFAEHIDIIAREENEASIELFSMIQQHIENASKDPNLEFIDLMWGRPSSSASRGDSGYIRWSLEEITNRTKKITGPEGNIIETRKLEIGKNPIGLLKENWCCFDQDRIKIISKVININILDECGHKIGTNRVEGSSFQEVAFGDMTLFDISGIRQDPGITIRYLLFLRDKILEYHNTEPKNYLKAAKRAYSFLKVSGDIAAAKSISDIFESTICDINSHLVSLRSMQNYLVTGGKKFSIAKFISQIENFRTAVIRESEHISPEIFSNILENISSMAKNYNPRSTPVIAYSMRSTI